MIPSSNYSAAAAWLSLCPRAVIQSHFHRKKKKKVGPSERSLDAPEENNADVTGINPFYLLF